MSRSSNLKEKLRNEIDEDYYVIHSKLTQLENDWDDEDAMSMEQVAHCFEGISSAFQDLANKCGELAHLINPVVSERGGQG